jgi:RimJ/RimL family protein N-acetyltransferase
MLDRLRWRRRRSQSNADHGSGDTTGPVGPLVREGELVRLRQHVPGNRSAFQRWYADPEIAYLLRHDLEPLSSGQSGSYFDSLIMPLSQRGLSYAIHEANSDRLIGTTALTDILRRTSGRRSALFRIVIGEKDVWDQGYGTEATRLVVAEAFETHDLTEVRLEVFRHNPRAIRAYERVGFEIVGEHVEWVGRSRRELQVIEMRLPRLDPDDEPAQPEEPEMTPALVEDQSAVDAGETEAERAARIARRRELQVQRRLEREAADEADSQAVAIQPPQTMSP